MKIINPCLCVLFGVFEVYYVVRHEVWVTDAALPPIRVPRLAGPGAVDHAGVYGNRVSRTDPVLLQDVGVLGGPFQNDVDKVHPRHLGLHLGVGHAVNLLAEMEPECERAALMGESPRMIFKIDFCYTCTPTAVSRAGV